MDGSLIPTFIKVGKDSIIVQTSDERDIGKYVLNLVTSNSKNKLELYQYIVNIKDNTPPSINMN